LDGFPAGETEGLFAGAWLILNVGQKQRRTMNDQRRQDILSWMLKESHDGKWWKPGSLTMNGNPDGKPPGNLTAAEDLSIFSDLKKKELLVSALNDRREPCFILNECKEAEWKAEVADAVKPFWRKSRLLKTVGKALLWILLAYAGGYLAARGRIAADSSSSTEHSSLPATPSGPKQ